MLNQLLNVLLVLSVVAGIVLFIKNGKLVEEKKRLKEELKDERRKQNK